MSGPRPLAASLGLVVAIAAFVAGGRAITSGELDAASLAVAALFASAAFASLALAGAWALRAPVRHTLGLGHVRTDARRTTTLIVGMLGWGVVVSLALAWTGAAEGSALETIDRAIAGAPGRSLPALGIAVAVLPGIAEELLFRGLVLGVLLDRYGVAVAIGVSTALFAATHVDGAHVLGAGALGLYLAGVRIATGSVLVCALCHIANNALAIGLATWAWPGWTDWLAIPAALAAAALGLRAIARSWPTASVATDRRGG